MAEYIEREAVLSRIKTLQETESATVGKKQFADGYFLGLDEAEIITRQAPAVDVVEVVRCKDCKHFTEGMAIGMCKRLEDKPILPIRYDHFCGYGERRCDK